LSSTRKNATAHNNLGVALARKGQFGRGHRLLQEGRRTRPENATAQNTFALRFAKKAQKK